MSRKRYDEEFKRKVIQEHEATGISLLPAAADIWCRC